MRQLWVWADIEAPSDTVWGLLVDPDAWPRWGPSVRDASVVGGTLEAGAHGKVTTALGVSLDFEITRFEPRSRWMWKVCGVTATDHRVEPLGADRCRAGIGVGWIAAPYLAICRIALGRLAVLATQ